MRRQLLTGPESISRSTIQTLHPFWRAVSGTWATVMFGTWSDVTIGSSFQELHRPERYTTFSFSLYPPSWSSVQKLKERVTQHDWAGNYKSQIIQVFLRVKYYYVLWNMRWFGRKLLNKTPYKTCFKKEIAPAGCSIWDL